MDILDKLKAYLRTKEISRIKKDREERIRNILDLIKKDKEPKEQIKTLETIKEQYDLWLTDYQNKSLKSLETLQNKVTNDLVVIEKYFGVKN